MNPRRFMDEHQVEDRSLAYLVGERAGSCITARWADNSPLWVKTEVTAAVVKSDGGERFGKVGRRHGHGGWESEKCNSVRHQTIDRQSY